MSKKTKMRLIGGREYRVLGSTIDYEGGRVVGKSYSVPGNRKVLVKNGMVTHPDGTRTPE